LNRSLVTDCSAGIYCRCQYGSYFGASLCAVDVNNDQLDDLLVGAPFYSERLGDEGSVSLFLNLANVRAALLQRAIVNATDKEIYC